APAARLQGREDPQGRPRELGQRRPATRAEDLAFRGAGLTVQAARLPHDAIHEGPREPGVRRRIEELVELVSRERRRDPWICEQTLAEAPLAVERGHGGVVDEIVGRVPAERLAK